jgi:hypothetical protein
MPTLSSDVDLLTQFLDCPRPEESERLLERVVGEQAAPVVEAIVSFKVRSDPAGEDVRSDVLAHLIGRLRELKSSDDRETIRDFRAYAAVAAYNGCNEHYRRSFPERRRLESRLRYLLASHENLTLWVEPDGEWMCGRRERRGGEPTRKTICGDAVWARSRETARVVEAILEECTGPMRFEDLVEQVARHWSISDRPAPAENASVEIRLVRRDGLKALWSEISRLPLTQRISLLLNMRDEKGGAALTLLPITGVATLAQIAKILEMSVEELAQLWNGLPVDDLRIAERLRLNRQQVINLRRSARERLKRALA